MFLLLLDLLIFASILESTTDLISNFAGSLWPHKQNLEFETSFVLLSLT